MAEGGGTTTDGRDTRWAEHRVARRAELVESTLRAIRRHGAGVGMDEIASEAGTSKTVIYRHFTDKAGLYVAVVASVDDLILREITAAAGGVLPADHDAGRPAVSPASVRAQLRRLVSAVVDSYLRLVERDPDVYRFVVARPLLDRAPEQDPVAGMTSRIGDHFAGVIAAQLRSRDADPAPAAVWGQGLVGLIRAVTDHWLAATDPLPRPALVALVTDLACGGLDAALELTETSTTEEA